jgi:MFS family permease
MTVPIYCVALVVALFMGWNADRTRQKAWHVIAACTWGVVCFVICVTVKSIPVRYTFICLGGAGVWSAVPLFLSWMVTMFDGREKRAVCIALINGVGNLASVYGSFFWPSTDGPRYVKGFAITSAFMGLAALVNVFNKWKFGDRGAKKTN